MGDISDEENPPYNVSLKKLATIGDLLLSHEKKNHHRITALLLENLNFGIGIENPNRQQQQNEVINQQQ